MSSSSSLSHRRRRFVRVLDSRFQLMAKKFFVYLEEVKALRDGGLWYFVGFGAVLILAIPFLLLELAILLLTGKELGWFPSVGVEEQGLISNGTQAATNVDEVMALLEPLRAPALHMVEATQCATFSKIGGHPEVPSGFAWPRWKHAPLAFIAQIDLAELGSQSVLEGLPESGLLWFFYDQDQTTWGFDPADRGSWCVRYAPKKQVLAPLSAPDGLSVDAVFGEKRVEFRPLSSYPTVDRVATELSGVSAEAWDAIESRRVAGYGEMPHHQIAGQPDAVQDGNMELECQLVTHGLYNGDGSASRDRRAQALESGASDWRLLLQVDTDDDIGMMWGDCGMLYFWIRNEDLQKKNFSETWMILQCS